MQHGSHQHLAGTADDVERALLVLDARKVDDDGVALADDLGLGHTDRVDALADDFNRDAERVLVERTLRFQSDGGTALQVETERRLVSGDQVARESRGRNDDDADERKEKTTTHAEA